MYADEWEHSGIDRAETPLFGCFRGGIIVAAGTCPPWGTIVRDRCDHPDHRGRGFGRSVVRAMTEYGLAEQPIMGYCTLEANIPALRIAQSLGYEGYALTLAVRLGK